MVAFAQAKRGASPAARATADALHERALVTPMCLGYGLIAAAQTERGDLEGARQSLAVTRTRIEGFQAHDDRATGALLVIRGAIGGPMAVEAEGYAVMQ